MNLRAAARFTIGVEHALGRREFALAVRRFEFHGAATFAGAVARGHRVRRVRTRTRARAVAGAIATTCAVAIGSFLGACSVACTVARRAACAVAHDRGVGTCSARARALCGALTGELSWFAFRFELRGGALATQVALRVAAGCSVEVHFATATFDEQTDGDHGIGGKDSVHAEGRLVAGHLQTFRSFERLPLACVALGGRSDVDTRVRDVCEHRARQRDQRSRGAHERSDTIVDVEVCPPLGLGGEVAVATFHDVGDIAATTNGCNADEAADSEEGSESMHA